MSASGTIFLIYTMEISYESNILLIADFGVF
jgi:hypothetical protein